MSYTGETSSLQNKPNIITNKKKRSTLYNSTQSEKQSKFKFKTNSLNVNSFHTFNNDNNSSKKQSIKEQINENNKSSLSPQNKKQYINRLKKKIKKLKTSKLYYKSLLKKISDKLKEFKKQNDKNILNEIMMTLINYKNKMDKKINNKIEKDGDITKNTDDDKNKNQNVINNVIVQNNNNYICSFSDLMSSDNNKSSSSTDIKNDFYIDKTSELSYNSEYVNLKSITKGEFVNNPKYMKKIINYIKELYIKYKNEKGKTAIIQLVKNGNEQKTLSIENIELNSNNNFLISSLHLIHENKVNNNNKININKSDNNISKNIHMNINPLYNYTFKMKFDSTINPNNINNINKKGSLQNLNPQIENHTQQKINNKFFSKILLNKNCISENDLEQKRKQKISNLNIISSKDKNEIKTVDNKDEIYFINDYNSSIEQNLKNETLSKKRQEFINIKQEVMKKHLVKNKNMKYIKKENNEKRNEFCIIS